MDSIVKLLLALIIGYCFVKLFCGCSVEGIREPDNPTPTSTPATNYAQLGAVFGCDSGEFHMSLGDCEKCPIGKIQADEGSYDTHCSECPPGSVPITNNGEYGHTGSTRCRYCGYGGGDPYEQRPTGYYGERYSDGTTCRNCPDNSSINQAVYKIYLPGQDWGGLTLKGGRNIDDCICDKGYTRNNDGIGGVTCVSA